MSIIILTCEFINIKIEIKEESINPFFYNKNVIPEFLAYFILCKILCQLQILRSIVESVLHWLENWRVGSAVEVRLILT